MFFCGVAQPKPVKITRVAHKNNVGIIFNTRVAEGCRSQFGVSPPNSAGIIFNTRDVWES